MDDVLHVLRVLGPLRSHTSDVVRTGRRALATGVAAAALLLAGCAAAASRPIPPPSPSLPTPVTTVSEEPVTPSLPPTPTTAAPTSASPTPSSTDPTPTQEAGSASPAPPGPVDGLIPVVTHIVTKDRVVFITIDDGYDKDPRVLDVLRRRHIPVTPFLILDAVHAKPAYFAAVQKVTGQSVQDHTLTHPHLSRLGYDAQVKEICDAATSLQGLYGTRPWLLRPPYGDYDRTTRRAAASCGMRDLVLWDVSLPHAVLRYASGHALQRGDIILIHWRPNLYRDINVAIDAALAGGLHVAALQDYLPAS